MFETLTEARDHVERTLADDLEGDVDVTASVPGPCESLRSPLDP